MKSKLATILVLLSIASTSVFAQLTGEYGRQMMTGGRGTGFFGIVGGLLLLGVTVLVWLWVVKLWKQIQHRK
ncbi:hypothetical protein COV18_07185 [Candidatus Woesearchaeota archaeon CG10_big_fil_rev_8_21_14_0_10_37_12]|nr:MAG: hypothetical protein COV18_07185 [Candidatus Woesearchaeota archaeon CG10_big_fil_rev_8_21_14_0_10_37_12]